MKSLVLTLICTFIATSSPVFAQDFSDADLAELGQAYVEAMNARDAAALDSLMSVRHMAEEIADFVADDASEKQELFDTFLEALPSINGRMISEMERQNAVGVFLRVHEFDGMRGPLARFNVGDGYNYVLLLPVRASRTGDELKIGDLFYATNGERLSQSIGVAAKLASAPSESFLGKLFGVNEVNREFALAFQEAGQLRQQNRLQEAFDVLDGLEGDIRDHRLILMNTIQIASQIDESMYRNELRRLATHHKDDPRVAFTLLDHYFYENDMNSAMSIVDLMEATYGNDAVLNIFRANIELARNNIEPALGYTNTAVELEPFNEDARWTLVTMLVSSEMYAETVQALQMIGSDFGYTFAAENFEAEPLYAGFVKSAEFAEWMGTP